MSVDTPSLQGRPPHAQRDDPELSRANTHLFGLAVDDALVGEEPANGAAREGASGGRGRSSACRRCRCGPAGGGGTDQRMATSAILQGGRGESERGAQDDKDETRRGASSTARGRGGGAHLSATTPIKVGRAEGPFGCLPRACCWYRATGLSEAGRKTPRADA